MLLKVGELASYCGVTVRTLHHYDGIGLLKPSARSDVGYRLYNRGDIARLRQIQALRRLGLSLSDVGAVLASPGSRLASIVEMQLKLLERQIDNARKLHDRLSRLQQQLQQGEEPELADWLTTLEMMTMYDKYFSAEELERLPLLGIGEPSTVPEWRELVGAVRELMNAGLEAESVEARALSKQWMDMVVRDTHGDPRLLVKVNAMHNGEPAIQDKTGVTPDLVAYVQRAVAASRLAIYEKYLSPAEFSFMRENYGKRSDEWPPLIAEVRQFMEEGVAADDPRMIQSARKWQELFRSYAGDNPETHAKIRSAHQAEQELMGGTFIDQAMLDYVKRAMRKLHSV